MAENKGTWLDTKSGKIVSSPPEEGIQLIAPGIEASPDEQANVERIKADLAGADEGDKTVTSKTVTGK